MYNKVQLSKTELRGFVKSLKNIKKQKFWIPAEAFETVHQTFSMWVLELVILQNNKILLTRYGEKYFKGMWHVPGGYNRLDEELDDICKRVAKREIGVPVKFIKTLGAYKWKKGEHPYGRPLSVYVLCKVIGKVKETESMKFFSIEKLPSPMIPFHKRCVKSLRSNLK